jgi:hypothetical protein
MPSRHLRRLALVAALAAACSGKKEAPPSPAPAAPSVPAARADPATEFARAMTDDKLQRLLAYEREILPLTAELVGGGARAAMASGGDGEKMGRELSRDERMRELSAQVEAAQRKHGITGQDQAGFTALTTELLVKEMFAREAREKLAANEPTKEAWARAEAEYEAKRKDPRAPPYAFVARKGTAPLPELVEKQLQEQVGDADAARKAFAGKYGQGALDVLAKYIPDFVDLREQQMSAVMKPR